MIVRDGPNPAWPGFVYFARHEAEGPIKIGRSWNVGCRLHELGGCRRATDVLLVVRSESLELRFHAAFEPHHIGHEWFEPVAEISDTIQAIHAGRFDWGVLPNPGWCVTKPFQTRASLRHWGPLPRYQREAA